MRTTKVSRLRHVIAAVLLPLFVQGAVTPSVAWAASAAPVLTDATDSGDENFPPVLIRWPLAAASRASKSVVAPAQPRVAIPPEVAPVAPAGAPESVLAGTGKTPSLPPNFEPAPPPSSPVRETPEPVTAPAVPPAGVQPVTAPVAPPAAVQPVAPSVVAPPSDKPPLERPPSLEPPPRAQPVPAPPRPPEGPREGAPAAAVEAPARERRPIETSPGPSPEELAILQPPVPPSAVDAGATPTLQPPTPEVRHWSFPDEGSLTWTSLSSRKEGDWTVLEGGVEIRVGLDRIQADIVRFDLATKQLVAENNVVLDHLDARVAGVRMEYDINTQTGTIYEAIGWTGDSYSFTGKRVEKIAADKYVIHDGTFTTCTQPSPVWRVDVSKATVHVDHFVYATNPRVVFKKMPAWYLPFAAFPIKQERSTGFMIPKANFSNTKGWSFEDEFFWAINRSTDMSVYGQWWSDYGFGAGLKARWHLGNMPQAGFVEAYFVHSDKPDPNLGVLLRENRYDIRMEHRQTLGEEWDFTVKGEYGSDQLFDKEYQPSAYESVSPIFNQRISMQRRWGKHSFNAYLENDQRDQYATADNIAGYSDDLKTTRTLNRNLPVFEYRSSGLQLWGRKWLALSMEGSLASIAKGEQVIYDYLNTVATPDYVSQAKMTTLDSKYQRADFYPQFRLPVAWSYLELTPSLNLRGTWWSAAESKSTHPEVVPIPPGTVSFDVRDSASVSTFLFGWDASLRMEGPDLERIYNVDAKPGHRKWQHLIQPSFEYRYTPQIDEPSQLLADSLQLVRGDARESHYSGRYLETGMTGTASIVNTLRSKLVPAEGEEGESSRDVLIWTLSTDYDFQNARSKGTVDGRQEVNWWGDLRSDLNFRPYDGLHFTTRTTYNVLADDFTQGSLTGGVDGDWGYVDLSFNSSRSVDMVNSNIDLSLTGENWFYKNKRIRLGYDLTRSFMGPPRSPIILPGNTMGKPIGSVWPYKKLVASYYSQCCGISLAWEDNDSRSFQNREKRWTFIVSLKDIGNYLRYRKSLTDD